MQISPDEIADILDAINKLDCASVEVTVGDVSITVRRGAALESRPVTAPVAIYARTEPVPTNLTPYTLASPKVDLAGWLEEEAQGKVSIMRAPMIGTFYSAKAPGEPAFVKVGAIVSPGDTLGLMEVMKLFNSLITDDAGTVEAIFANNGDMVEFDEPVFVIRKVG